MINAMQRTLRPFLITILTVITLSFVFFTAMPNFDRFGGQSAVAKIEGHGVRQEDFYNAGTEVSTIFVLKYGRPLEGIPEVEKMIREQAWRRLLLLSEAKKLGIHVDDQEVFNFIQQQPLLSEKGQFSPQMYTQFQNYYLQPRGINETKFEQFIRDEIASEEVQKLIISPLQVTSSEVAENFKMAFSPVKMNLAAFSLKDYLPKVEVSEEEIQKAYQAEASTNPEWKTKERRKVSYISFLLSPGQQKLPAAEKEKAKRELAEKALRFRQLLDSTTEGNEKNNASFTQEAAEQKLSLGATALFSQDETPTPLTPSPHFNQAAFQLTSERPLSNVIETDDGFFIIRLEQVEQSVLRPLPEIKSLISDELKNRKAMVLMRNEGMKAAVEIKAEVAKGTSFAQAAKAFPCKIEALPAFVPGDPNFPNDPKLQAARSFSLSLPVHGVSDFLPMADEGFILQLDSRETPDLKKYSGMENQIAKALLNQSQELAEEEWFRVKNENAGTQPPRGVGDKE